MPKISAFPMRRSELPVDWAQGRRQYSRRGSLRLAKTVNKPSSQTAF
jgi:hypothetical protein